MIIQLKNVNFKYFTLINKNETIKRKIINQLTNKKSFFEHDALKNISFSLKSGDRLGIIGKNGSGKSTLLKVLSNQLPIFSGKIELPDENKIMCILKLTAGLNLELNAYENIKLLSLIYEFDNKIKYKDYNEIIEYAEIGKFKHYPLNTYSSGMIIRLAFSCLTFFKTECLILDEWLSVGDNDFRLKAMQRLKNLIKNSKIFILASHDENLIKNLCNKILKLENGIVVEKNF